MTALDRETRDTLRLCWDFLKRYEDLFLDTDYYRMRRDFVMVRKEMSGVLIRHEKKTRRSNESA
jgi:hypothetical protein